MRRKAEDYIGVDEKRPSLTWNAEAIDSANALAMTSETGW